MIHHLMYIELKTGYSDDGPALDWLCQDIQNQKDNLL